MSQYISILSHKETSYAYIQSYMPIYMAYVTRFRLLVSKAQCPFSNLEVAVFLGVFPAKLSQQQQQQQQRRKKQPTSNK